MTATAHLGLTIKQGATFREPLTRTTSEACAVGVLAELLGKEQHRARTYAAEADEARAAGLTCERAYDAARQALGQRGGKYGF